MALKQLAGIVDSEDTAGRDLLRRDRVMQVASSCARDEPMPDQKFANHAMPVFEVPAIPGFPEPTSDQQAGAGPADAVKSDVVEANTRFTAVLGAVLTVVLAVELATVVLGVRGLLGLHVVAGFILAALVVPKLATTGRRMVKYYRHDDAFVAAGPPAPLLRILGPLMAVVTVALLGSGMAALLGPSSLQGDAKSIHMLCFWLFLLLVIVHTAAHLRESARSTLADVRRSPAVTGRRTRWATVAAAMIIGGAAGGLAATYVAAYLTRFPHGFH